MEMGSSKTEGCSSEKSTACEYPSEACVATAVSPRQVEAEGTGARGFEFYSAGKF